MKLAETPESPLPIPKTPSVFHLDAQRNAFRRRDVHLQSRLFAPENQQLRRIPTSNRASRDCQR